MMDTVYYANKKFDMYGYETFLKFIKTDMRILASGIVSKYVPSYEEYPITVNKKIIEFGKLKLPKKIDFDEPITPKVISDTAIYTPSSEFKLKTEETDHKEGSIMNVYNVTINKKIMEGISKNKCIPKVKPVEYNIVYNLINFLEYDKFVGLGKLEDIIKMVIDMSMQIIKNRVLMGSEFSTLDDEEMKMIINSSLFSITYVLRSQITKHIVMAKPPIIYPIPLDQIPILKNYIVKAIESTNLNRYMTEIQSVC
jgi:hypothetical protein